MKYFKLFLPIIAVFLLMGCSKVNSKSAVSPSTQTKASPASQSQATAPPSQTVAIDPSQATAVAFQWLGLDKDQLSPNELKPDGKQDGHFHITIPFSQPSAVKSIWIRYSEFGKSLKWGWIYNINLPQAGYRMAVFDSQGKLIPPQADNGYSVNGLTDFDLYLSELNGENGQDTFKFEKGQTFNLEIDYVTQDNQEKEFDSSVQTT